MAKFDTALVLETIVHQVLADHETNRQIIDLIEDTRDTDRGEEGDRIQLVWGVLELALRQMAQTSHGRDLVVGLVDRFTDEARADALARIELTAAGLDEEEIEEALRDYPEEFTPEALEVRYTRHRVKPEDLMGVPFRGPTHQELMDAGAI